jgi:hypothetical protein
MSHQSVTCRRGYLLWLTAVVLIAISGFGQTEPDPWLILVSGEKGFINAHRTRQNLVSAFGASNVVDQDVDVGEGETVPGTVLFPKDPKLPIEILWKDPDKKTQPSLPRLRGARAAGKPCTTFRWGRLLKIWSALTVGRSTYLVLGRTIPGQSCHGIRGRLRQN